MVCYNVFEMIKGNRKEILIHLLIMLVPIVAAMLLWKQLPDRIQLPLNLGDGMQLFSNKIVTIIVLNFPWIILYGFEVLVTSADDRDVVDTKKGYFIEQIILPVASVFLNGITFNYALDKSSTHFYIGALVSFLLIIICYYLSKKRKIFDIGIILGLFFLLISMII